MIDQNISSNTFFTAGEAYIQATANKWQQARKHLNSTIIKINKAINQGKFEIEVEPGFCTEVDIEFLENHGYKFLSREKIGGYYDKISWNIKENESKE